MKAQEWKPATVTKQTSPRGYVVTTPEGRSYERNRKFIKPIRNNDNVTSAENDNNQNVATDNVDAPTAAKTTTNASASNDQSPAGYTTKSERAVKVPQRLIAYT